MRKLFRSSLLAAGLAATSLFTPSFAGEDRKGFYITGSVGIADIYDIDISSTLGGGSFQFDPGFNGEVGAGYAWGNGLRTEFSYNSLNSDMKSIQGASVSIPVDVTSWFVTGAYDFRQGKKWQPYVSGSIGTSNIDVEVATTIGSVAVTVGDDEVTTLAGKLGMTYEASEKVDIYGEGWIHSYDDFTIGAISFTDCVSTGLSVGLRVKI